MNVYWSVYLNGGPQIVPFVAYLPPVRLSDQVSDIDVKELEQTPRQNFKLCPAVLKQARNTFALQFPFDYDLKFEPENNRVSTSLYDEGFFKSMVNIRSTSVGNYSINLSYIFIAEEPLEIEWTSAHFSDNEFTRKTMLIPGTFDIGKWPRPLDCAFLLRDGVRDLTFSRGEDFGYVRFLTNENINLQKFYPTQKMADISSSCLSARAYKKSPIAPLTHWYNLYKGANMHKTLIDEIKANLM